MEIAEKAQRRLCQRYYQLLKRGKTAGQATTAVGRELLGFAWAIAQAVAHPITDDGGAADDDDDVAMVAA